MTNNASYYLISYLNLPFCQMSRIRIHSFIWWVVVKETQKCQTLCVDSLKTVSRMYKASYVSICFIANEGVRGWWWCLGRGKAVFPQYSVGCFCQSRPLSTARLSSKPSIIFIHRRALAHLCLGVFSAYIHALYMHLHRCVDVERCISKCICVQKNHLAPMSTHIYMRTHWSKPLAWISVFE